MYWFKVNFTVDETREEEEGEDGDQPLGIPWRFV